MSRASSRISALSPPIASRNPLAVQAPCALLDHAFPLNISGGFLHLFHRSNSSIFSRVGVSGKLGAVHFCSGAVQLACLCNFHPVAQCLRRHLQFTGHGSDAWSMLDPLHGPRPELRRICLVCYLEHCSSPSFRSTLHTTRCKAKFWGKAHVIKNIGRRLWMISDDTSMSRLTHPSTQTLQGIWRRMLFCCRLSIFWVRCVYRTRRLTARLPIQLGVIAYPPTL
jgi:hypothetical protein